MIATIKPRYVTCGSCEGSMQLNFTNNTMQCLTQGCEEAGKTFELPLTQIEATEKTE